MAETKRSGGRPAGDAQGECSRVELVWPGKRREVDRVVLPFQCIEVVNESRATREADKTLPMLKEFKKGESGPAEDAGWRNKLIWGENKYVLGSLLEQYAGQVDLIYIDPPFASGSDFSFLVEVGDQSVAKEPSLIEEKAYRDTWGRGVVSYYAMMYERLVLMRELLSSKGVIFLHCDWHVNSGLRLILDEVFGAERFVNEVVWKRSDAKGDAGQGSRHMPRVHDTIFVYTKTEAATWNAQYVPLSEGYVAGFYKHKDPDGRVYKLENMLGPGGARKGNPVYEVMGVTRPWRYSRERMQRLIDEGLVVQTRPGTVPMQKKYLEDSKGRQVGSWWDDISMIRGWSGEKTGFKTQKPEELLVRIIEMCSNKGDLVADFFIGSGTTVAVAEALKRRWIGCDLSRWGIQVARKRLLDTEGCRPFEVLNLGKYERQYWQGSTFGKGRGQQKALHEYVRFVLDLYRAEPSSGLAHIHGQRGGTMIHIGAADSPVTLAEIREAVDECKKIKQGKLDILGWEWEMGLHDVVEAESKRSDVKLRLLQIPRECMDQRAVDAGDVHFYELAYLEVVAEKQKGAREVRVELKNFVIPSPELIPDEVRSKITKWSDFVDYWSVDFEFNEDVFHNQWQDYRTRSKRDLELTTDWHAYAKGGAHKVLVKVFDIFGNDTTHVLEVRV